MTWIQVFILGIIEGLTEFLPVSSTGHMVLASHFLGIAESDFTKAFEVIIQMGAILTIVVMYWRRFLSTWSFYRKITLAFIPTGIIGFILKHQVDRWLESPSLVAWSLILGGIVLVFIERIFPGKEGFGVDDIPDSACVKLGVFQSLAMVPGVSRSGATIVGALSLGMRKPQAAEFSFFLAVPTMAAATLYKIYVMVKGGIRFETEQWQMLAAGTFIAFVVAAFAIRGFLGIIKNRTFAGFGIYRIIMGAVILVLLAQGGSL